MFIAEARTAVGRTENSDGTEEAGSFAALSRRPASIATDAMRTPVAVSAASTVGVFRGFDILDRPLVTSSALPGEIVAARSVIAMTQAMVGAEVLLTLHDGDPQRPIILGVMHDGRRALESPVEGGQRPDIRIDDERVLISAEREVVLRCGDASITLTRAGKVLIEGNFILSRSTGYNKIKGAAIDIN
jgi:hypothetical protein